MKAKQLVGALVLTLESVTAYAPLDVRAGHSLGYELPTYSTVRHVFSTESVAVWRAKQQVLATPFA